jgi:hypothetical protein
MKPSGLFCFSRMALSLSGTFSWIKILATDLNDPQPPDAKAYDGLLLSLVMVGCSSKYHDVI